MNTIGALIVWTLFGLVAGLIARFLVPGRQPMGWLATIMLGVIGSYAGGFLTYAVRGGEMWQPAGMLMSILGAVVVLFLYISMAKGRTV
ncbi:GlsB/YeaQ/YmgE family stress response membrane protein [Planctomicrobium sp. SH661]|uniref:GlsB/YeaQ/YmgE family stress response membrane protein n=1 Tax=Planctomicrobium sp. SH661 TaxID=3448124 RepID=UPI003F5C7B60